MEGAFNGTSKLATLFMEYIDVSSVARTVEIVNLEIELWRHDISESAIFNPILCDFKYFLH